MNTAKVVAFMRQPSTVLGISTLIGTLTAVLTAQLTWQNAVPAIAGALAAIALPDNPRAKIVIKDAASAVVTAEQTVANSAKETAAIGVAKAASLTALLLAGSFALSARAIQPAVQAHAVVRLQSISALVIIPDAPINTMASVTAVDKILGVAQ